MQNAQLTVQALGCVTHNAQLAMHNAHSKEKRIWFRFQIRFVLKSRQNALGLRSNLWGSLPYPLTAKRNPSAPWSVYD